MDKSNYKESEHYKKNIKLPKSKRDWSNKARSPRNRYAGDKYLFPDTEQFAMVRAGQGKHRAKTYDVTNNTVVVSKTSGKTDRSEE